MDNEDVDDLATGEPGPDKEPKSSKAWMAMIVEAEKTYKNYQDKADNIDKLYANLDRLASSTRDRQFQLFWANIQVLGPSIYSRPPVPVVVPRFKDRRPLPRVTSELLERSTIVMFELEDIDGVMRLIRDDLTRLGRGVAWVRYEASGKANDFRERACIHYTDRKDFLHDPARTWPEVDWVARASYLDKKAMRKRFRSTSGDEYKNAAYEVRKDDAGDDEKLKAKVWEVWSKSLNRVVWVSEGCEKLLDDGPPHLKLENFFPCPRPAYSTVQPRTLIPVPDMVFYKDQLEEINELTARIGALTDAVKLRGFYPAGAGEIGDAVEAAIKATSDNVVLIPISNWSLLGGGAAKDTIVWLPLDMVVAGIKELVALRKELIDDVYQITGLSDIMRGSTEASETLGAQELKSQYGSVRIKDRQSALVDIALDITRIVAEIMAENFQPKTLLEMSQLEIETEAQCRAQYAPLEQQLAQIAQQIQQAQSDPEIQAMAQANPEKAQEVIGQAKQQAQQLQEQIAKAKQKPTVEKVMAFLRDQRLRPYTLDIETDSTIAPDENAAKQRATEYVTAVGGFIANAVPLVAQAPQIAPVVADVLKYAASQFRAGRAVEQSIEEFADQMKQMAAQPKGPDPETIKAQGEAQSAQAQAQKTQADAVQTQADAQRTAVEAQSKAADDEQNRRIALAEAVDAARSRSQEIEGKQRLADLEMGNKAQKHQQDMDIGALQLEKLRLEIEGVQIKTQAAVATTQAKIDQTNTQTDATVATTDAKIEQAKTQTDNSIATTEAGIAATERSTEIKAEQAKEPA
jgi:hypothetical protein